MHSRKLRLEDVLVESFHTGSDREGSHEADAYPEFLNTGLVKCGTNFGPRCDTQKQTGPCGAC